MKDGLENSFKKALNDFEYPYDANAWDALNQKLSPKKWYQHTGVKWSAALVVVAGITALFFARNADERKTSLPTTNATSKEQTKQELTTKTPTEKSNLLRNNPLINEAPEEIQLQENVVTMNAELFDVSLPNILTDLTNQENILDLKRSNEKPDENILIIDNTNGIAIYDFKNRCQGEIFSMEADPKHQRMINYAGKSFHFNYNEAISIKLEEAGKVQLTANSGPYGQFEEFGSFDVKESPSINLTTDRTVTYEDGLPKISCNVESSEQTLSWHSNYSLSNASGKSTQVLAFDKGNVIVEVQASSSNGCVSIEKELITVSSDYNLLAVNAFNPQSLNSRNNTFMPFALTIRETPFKLIVLDPDNGGLVFESTDADNAWDGIDRRDGVMVPNNKAYIWKVVLQKPVAGEKAEYRGTIVRM